MFDPITADELRRRLDYTPATGRFVWKSRVSQAVRAGDVAGCYDKRTGYIDIGTCGKLYRAHRLAFLYMTGKWPEHDIDHINGVRSDNRWANLRAVTRSTNQHNCRMKGNNTSGVCGVSWYKYGHKWQAQIQHDGKIIYLGRFVNKDDAIAARRDADRRYGFTARHGAAT